MEEKVLEVLNEVNPKIGKDIDVNLLEEGLIDSFAIVNIVMGLEEMFDIEIDPELVVAENFQTVAGIVKLIKSIE